MKPKAKRTLENYMKCGAIWRILTTITPDALAYSKQFLYAKDFEKLRKVYKAIDEIKCQLDTQLFEDCCTAYENNGGDGNHLCDVFYGASTNEPRPNGIDEQMLKLMTEYADKLVYREKEQSHGEEV